MAERFITMNKEKRKKLINFLKEAHFLQNQKKEETIILSLEEISKELKDSFIWDIWEDK
jgi:hypothetical protein